MKRQTGAFALSLLPILMWMAIQVVLVWGLGYIITWLGNGISFLGGNPQDQKHQRNGETEEQSRIHKAGNSQDTYCILKPQESQCTAVFQDGPGGQIQGGVEDKGVLEHRQGQQSYQQPHPGKEHSVGVAAVGHPRAQQIVADEKHRQRRSRRGIT